MTCDILRLVTLTLLLQFCHPSWLNPQQCDSSTRRLITNTWQGVISDGAQNYSKATECEWLIRAPYPGKFIELSFSSFATECLYDYVSIYDGTGGRKLAALSGNEPVRDVLSTTGTMYIHLLSDAGEVLPGFDASFKIYECPKNCTNTTHGSCNTDTNKCLCNKGWYGEGCSESYRQCGEHGILDTVLNKCHCIAGYFGWQCDIPQVDVDTEAYHSTPAMDTGTHSYVTQTPNKWYKAVRSQTRHSIIYYQKQGLLPRMGHTADIIGDYLYVFGGFDLNSVMYNFSRLSMLSGVWEDVEVDKKSTATPAGRYMHKSVVYNDSLIVCGGYLQPGRSITNQCCLFNTTTRIWQLFNRTIPPPTVGHSLTLVDDKDIYLFGGMNGVTSSYSCELYKLDLENGEGLYWQEIKPRLGKCQTLRRAGHTTVYDAISRQLIVLGGMVPDALFQSKRSSDLLAYNIDKTVWTVLSEVQGVRGLVYHTAILIGRFMIVYGGSVHNQEDLGECYNNQLFILDLNCYQWLLVPTTGAPDIVHAKHDQYRHCHAATVYKQYMVVVAGFDGQPMNDVWAYYPPSQDCGEYDERDCDATVHCTLCGGSCVSRKECSLTADTCSICKKISSCLSCVLWNCEWCVEQSTCRDRGSRELCGVTSPRPWWEEGTILNTTKECQAKDMGPGLHWLTYVDPLNYQHPDDLSIITLAKIQFQYQKRTREDKNTDMYGKRRYWGIMRGFIDPFHRVITDKTKDDDAYQLKMSCRGGNAEIYLSNSDAASDKVLVAKCQSRGYVTKSTFPNNNKMKLPMSNKERRYIEATIHQFITEPQKPSLLTLKWNGGGENFSMDEILTQDVLIPYQNGTCHHHTTCIGCLTDQLCGWCHIASSNPRCQRRGDPLTLCQIASKSSNYLDSTYLATTVEQCIRCGDHLDCSQCIQETECEWFEFQCFRRGRYDHAISQTTVQRCPSSCSEQKTCTSCTDGWHEDCVWCLSLRKCFSSNTRLLYPFGLCHEWANSESSKVSGMQCLDCEMFNTCKTCLEVQGCGWCGITTAPHNGRCIQGTYNTGDCQFDNIQSPMQWYYESCPLINECQLELDNCHQFAVCTDLVQGFTCECNKGYEGNGEQCNSTCEDQCKDHGTCNSSNECECNIGYTGQWCNEDCGCNGHSTCNIPNECFSCLDMTDGRNCERCSVGGFRLTSNLRAQCDPCDCNEHHDSAQGYCHPDTGVCYCKDHTTGDNCQTCEEGYYGDATNNGFCYMMARSRTLITSTDNGGVGNKQRLTLHRTTDNGYQHTMWILAPLTRMTIVLRVDSITSGNTDLPGTLYIWEGLPPYISGSPSLSSRLLLKLSADMIVEPFIPVVVSADGSATVLYEGLQTTVFNISYKMRNCSYNCVSKSHRFSTKCGRNSHCVCDPLFMGTDCGTRVCPDSCNNQGECVQSTGACKCTPAMSGESCSERSTAEKKWAVEGYDWAPDHQQGIMEGRMGHSALNMIVGGQDVIVIHGGYSLWTIYSNTWLFYMVRQEWGTVSPVLNPPPVYLHSAVLLDIPDKGRVMCRIGGMTPEGLTSEMWCLSLAGTVTWLRLKQVGLPAVAGSAVAVVQGSVYLFGGMTEAGPSNHLYRLEALEAGLLTIGQWRLVTGVAGVIPPMYGHTMVYHASSHSLYIVASCGFYALRLNTKTWQTLQTHHHQTRYHCATLEGDLMYLYGGKVPSSIRGQKDHNQFLFVVQLVHNTWVKVDPLSDTSGPGVNIGGQLTSHSNKLYVLGGYNGTVHSFVQTFQLMESICLLLKRKTECHKFGCFWCPGTDNPKPCVEQSVGGCAGAEGPLLLDLCLLQASCSGCNNLAGCRWGGGGCVNTLSNAPNTGVACRDDAVCSVYTNCTSCHTDGYCSWTMGTCLHTSNIALQHTRACAPLCTSLRDCSSCTVTKDCSWSKALGQCIHSHHNDWFCLFNRCDLVVGIVQCPVPCSDHLYCTVCREHAGCGWCSQGTGSCMEGAVLAGHTCPAPAWHYFDCPPEDECLLDLHVCRSDQVCVDKVDGYECQCKAGTTESELESVCVPSCNTHGCVHGVCAEVDTCKCDFGYYGLNCQRKCDCSGHSECDGMSCLQCFNNTLGKRCEKCLPLHVRNGSDCVQCKDVCHGASEICGTDLNPYSTKAEILSLTKTGPSSISSTVCKKCQGNTQGRLCERCMDGYFIDRSYSDRLKCRPCECNLHADRNRCNQETGGDCKCQNNTMSSCQSADSQDCYKRQCDLCINEYQGTPIKGAQCYKHIRNKSKETGLGMAAFARFYQVNYWSTKSDVWIYIKMINVTGVILVTDDPQQFIVLTGPGGQHYISSNNYQRDYRRSTGNDKRSAMYHHGDPYTLFDIRNFPQTRNITLPWISHVDRLEHKEPFVMQRMNNERNLINIPINHDTPDNNIYIVVYTFSNQGSFILGWYQEEQQINIYMISYTFVASAILLVLAGYSLTELNLCVRDRFAQQQNNQERSANSKRPSTTIQLDVTNQDLDPIYTPQYSAFHPNQKFKYTTVNQSNLPSIRPAVLQRPNPSRGQRCTGCSNEKTAGHCDCDSAICTVFIRTPGHRLGLVMGTALVRTKPGSSELPTPDETYNETTL